jgi:hypothetical protein
MSFEVKSTVSKKKPSRKGKAPATSGEQWITVISENETFSEPLWGYDTSMFLQAINHIPVSNMKTIIEQAQQYMKSMTTCCRDSYFYGHVMGIFTQAVRLSFA